MTETTSKVLAFLKSMRGYLLALVAGAVALAYMSRASSQQKSAARKGEALKELQHQELDEQSAEYQQAKADMEAAEAAVDATLEKAKVKLDELANGNPNGPDLLDSWNRDRLSKPSDSPPG